MGKKPSPVYEFVASQLEKDPTLTFRAIKARGEAAGFDVLPVVFGRAQALLGLVPVTPYGEKSRRRRAGARLLVGPAVGTGHPSVDGLLERIRHLEVERDAALDTLRHIRALLSRGHPRRGGAQ